MSELQCHFCGRDLPEEGNSHVIYAKGFLQQRDPSLEDYAVCGACMRFHKLKMSKLVSRGTLKRQGLL